MENIIMERITQEIRENRSVALCIVTKAEGGAPGKEGFMMGVFEDGSIVGTVGGGAIELATIKKASECIKSGKDGSFSFDLGREGNLGMICGGKTEVYVKTFKAPDKLLIIGGGHVALELYKLCEFIKFRAVIFEDREEFGDQNRFPNAEIVLGDYYDSLQNYQVDENCYIVIVTKGHRFDQNALEAAVNSSAKYIGMIGSLNKTKAILENLKDKGIDEEKLERVYAPIGLSLGGDSASEIAISIVSEILLVKNNGTLAHMKERLKD